VTRSRWILAAAALAAAALALFLLLREPRLRLADADGAYWHDCCGTLELRGGELVLEGRKKVAYALEEDEQGVFVLPATFVGTWEDRGFEVDGTRPPVPLRLDKFPKPERIVLPAPRGSYSFRREVPKRR
jgi:hypothetical protein